MKRWAPLLLCAAACGAPEQAVTYCGDQACNLGETATSCPRDCADTCGNGVCGMLEDALLCAADCPDTCGNGLCGSTEDPVSCSADCPASCGDGVCTSGETSATCLPDCPEDCGNGTCGLTETPRTCATDCGPPFLTVDGLPEENLKTPDRAIDDVVRIQMDRQRLVGVGIAVLQEGEVLYQKGYGYQDLENAIPVLSYRTMFRWASISKTLTAVVALTRTGTIDFDAPINRYYPDYQTPTDWFEMGVVREIPVSQQREITGRMLLSHTGGISHYQNGQANPTPPAFEINNPSINDGIEWAMAYLVERPLVQPPGVTYSYSTFGFNLMGVVLEQATDLPFATLVGGIVADQHGLTSLQPDYEFLPIEHRAVGYLGETNVGSSDVSWKLPGGGFISTVEDLGRYCGLLSGRALIDEAEKEAAFNPVPTGSEAYGLGFGLGERNGLRFVGHSGSQQKTRTRLRLYPDDGLCIVVMTNSELADTLVLLEGIEDAVR